MNLNTFELLCLNTYIDLIKAEDAKTDR